MTLNSAHTLSISRYRKAQLSVFADDIGDPMTLEEASVLAACHD